MIRFASANLIFSEEKSTSSASQHTSTASSSARKPDSVHLPALSAPFRSRQAPRESGSMFDGTNNDRANARHSKQITSKYTLFFT